jgi:hypothetical protein
VTTKVIGKTRCPNCAKKGADTRGDNLIKYSDGGSYCFACGFHSGGTKKLFERYEQPPPNVDTIRPMPEDVERLTAKHAGWHWLNQYLKILPQDLLWSSSQQWLIFPYRRDGQLFAWQARNFNEVGPKWLTFGSVTDDLYILGDQRTPPFLVEDIVSAIKIKQAGGTAIPLFNCTIGLERTRKLIARFKLVSLWLDPDKRKETVLEAHRAFKLGLHMKIMLSESDPKEHTMAYLREQVA